MTSNTPDLPHNFLHLNITKISFKENAPTFVIMLGSIIAFIGQLKKRKFPDTKIIAILIMMISLSFGINNY